jgi:hypothetical protein
MVLSEHINSTPVHADFQTSSGIRPHGLILYCCESDEYRKAGDESVHVAERAFMAVRHQMTPTRSVYSLS